jgi:hypothetical protein
MILDLLFNGANLFVLPFWALMILLPNWGVTRKVMGSFLPFVALASVYLYLFINSLDPETAQSFSDPQLGLSDIAQLFSTEAVAGAAWVHFLVMDLFVGRWIYWEGQRTGTWTIHSLALCLFAGPLGLLSHLLTSAIRHQFFRPPTEGTPQSQEPVTSNQ